MNPGLIFLIAWLGFCGCIVALIGAVFNFDRIVVFLLRAANAPVYEEARRIAALIYQHPEQWKMATYTMAHPRIGEIWCGTGCNSSVHVEGDGFGKWESNLVERRIIYDAVAWYRRDYIKHLLTQVLNAPALNVP